MVRRRNDRAGQRFCKSKSITHERGKPAEPLPTAESNHDSQDQSECIVIKKTNIDFFDIFLSLFLAGVLKFK